MKQNSDTWIMLKGDDLRICDDKMDCRNKLDETDDKKCLLRKSKSLTTAKTATTTIKTTTTKTATTKTTTTATNLVKMTNPNQTNTATSMTTTTTTGLKLHIS